MDAIKTLLAASDEQDDANGFSFHREVAGSSCNTKVPSGAAGEEEGEQDQGGDKGVESTAVASGSNAAPISKKDKRRQKKAAKNGMPPAAMVQQSSSDGTEAGSTNVVAPRCSAVEVRSVDGFQVRYSIGT